MQVIADTSFLMIPGMFGVDINNELDRLLGRRHEFLILGSVMRELKKISQKGKPKERAAAKIGLLIAKCGKVVEDRGGADESILRLAARKKCPVGTIDAGLRKGLRKIGIPVIYLREMSHLAADGDME